MQKLMILGVVLLAVAVPASSIACHVTEVTGNADCNGWSLCTSIYFTSGTDEGSLAYTVTIMAGEEVVISMGDTVVVTHEPGEGTYEFCFDGLWEGVYPISEATVVLTSSLDGGEPVTFTFDLDCAVGSDHITFDGLKSQYR